MQLLRPSVLCVAVPNNWQEDVVVSAQARMQSVRSKEHVQRIVDGYHRICMGALSSRCCPTMSGFVKAGCSPRQ
jgi:hypothetical protein